MKLAIMILRLLSWGIVLWAALIIISTSGKAQSAERILQQATRAQGGERALQKANALQAQGRITRTSDGKAGQIWLATARPNSYAMGLDFDGFILSEGSNGKSGWRRDSGNGLRTLTGRESLDFQTAATFRNQRWLEHKKQKAKLMAEATTTLNGKPVNVLNFVTHRGLKFKLFFDAASGLLVREEFLLGDSRRSIEYRAYRNVDGVQEPFALTIREGEERFEVQFDSVTHTAALHSQFEKFSQKSAGAMWIDAKALQVARLEGELTEELKFGGFLGAVKSAAFLSEQTPINDEIWLPIFSEFNLGARAPCSLA